MINIIFFWVDDIILVHDDRAVEEWFVTELSKRFALKDLGEVSWFLGLRITRDKDKGLISLDQAQYVEKVLKKCKFDSCRSSHIPAQVGAVLRSVTEDGEKVTKWSFAYQQAIGSIMYAMTGTRPDLASAVSNVSRFANAPGVQHYQAVETILRYLRGTSDLQLVLGTGGNDTTLHGFCDATWASDSDTRKSTTGYIFFLGNSPISWCSQRQHTVALSATEAEYMAISAAARECVWLRSLLSDLSLRCSGPTVVRCDNRGAVCLSENPVKHRANKHIDVRHHYVRDLVMQGQLAVVWTSSEDMVADVLTKALPRSRYEKWKGVLLGYGIPHI